MRRPRRREAPEKAGVTGQMWLGIISSATMLFLAAPAFADACLFQPRRPFQLSSDTVEAHKPPSAKSVLMK
jgi:hypothetical protein